MNPRPDIAAALAPGEVTLWQGQPKPGRKVPMRAHLVAVALYAGTVGLILVAGYVEVFWSHLPALRLSVYGLIAAAAFLTYAGLRVTLLQNRRARARDKRTAYAITTDRALTLSGPYSAEMPLGPGLGAEVQGDTLVIIGLEGALRMERLDDAARARDILLGQIEGQT